MNDPTQPFPGGHPEADAGYQAGLDPTQTLYGGAPPAGGGVTLDKPGVPGGGWSRQGPIEITFDDLSTPEVEATVGTLRAAANPSIVRAVGSQPAATSSVVRSVATTALAGLAGGIVGALFAELVARPDHESHWYGNGSKMGATIWFSCFVLGLGTAFCGRNGIEARSGAKFGRDLARSLPVLLVGAVLGGFIAQAAYSPLISRVIRRAITRSGGDEQRALDLIASGIHLPRGLGFLIAGAFLGLAVGATRFAVRPALNGLAGGAIGGFLGGFLFDFVGTWVDKGVVARTTALTITGVLIGVATGLVEEATKQHWLEIVTGGMAGKQFIVFTNRTTLGGAPSCDITLIKDPTLAPEHVLLTRQGARLQLTALSPHHPVTVNGMPAGAHQLADGDLVQLGSTVVRYRSRGEALPTAIGPLR